MLLVALDSDPERTKYFAIGGAALSLVLFPFIDSGTTSVEWFLAGGAEITISASITPVSSILLFMVLLVAPLVFVYSAGYMTLPSEQKRYYIEMLAFDTSMLAFAMAGDFILLFMAWEFLSLTSYLLIGFWHSRERAISAARKAITIILIGDIALLSAIAILQNSFGTLSFSGILSSASASNFPKAAGLLLLAAIMSKSAQFPFQEWLPDAMEGPTPVSAFLHSATMVKAGVFVAIILFPLLSAAGVLQLMLPIGAITVITSLFSALGEQHVKRVLAYSTVQELGLMMMAIAINALIAAVYFFFAQTFYKALLFFSSGVAMKATEKENLHEISGIKENRLVYVATTAGVLALAGFIPFDGFFANIGIDSAFSANLAAYAIMILVSAGTSLYIFRWLFLQDKKPSSQKVMFAYSSTPDWMIYSMAALAALALLASAGFFIIPGMLSGISYIAAGTQLSLGTPDALIETVAVAAGLAGGYFIFYRNRLALSKRATLQRYSYLVHTAQFLNSGYRHIAGFAETLGDGAAFADSLLDELFDGFGHEVMRFSELPRRLAAGSVNGYVALFAAGVVVLVLVVAVI